MSLCDSCIHRAIPDGGGERIVCRWYYVLDGIIEQLRSDLIQEGASPVDLFDEPSITQCRAYESNGQEKSTGKLVALPGGKHE